jgi:tRNA pseudouridine55 synthase
LDSGILLLDKPLGWSSNAALQRVRRLLGADKAGHVGSLDPLATGMLPICIGEATKIAGDIVAGRKRYRFTIALGARTATGDGEGPVVETAAIPPLSSERLAAVLSGFLGRVSQVPPMYSALKRAGQPLYRLARAGIEVESAPREIEISELRVLTLEAATVELETSCSKGTYIRTLAEDIARALGTCGHVSRLRREYVEPFETEPMETLEAVATARANDQWPRMLPADRAVLHLPAVSLDAPAVVLLAHGQQVAIQEVVPAGRVRLYDASGRFFGIGAADGCGAVRPKRLFVAR